MVGFCPPEGKGGGRPCARAQPAQRPTRATGRNADPAAARATDRGRSASAAHEARRSVFRDGDPGDGDGRGDSDRALV